MLLSRAQETRRRKLQQPDESVEFPVETDPGWPVFVQRLEVSGYFKDLLKGSREWDGLMEHAKVFYRQNVGRRRAGDDDEDDFRELLRAYEDIQSIDMETAESKSSGFLYEELIF